MPDGKTHRKIWKSFIPLAIAIGLFFVIEGWWYFALFFLVGYGLHFLGITNDLDLISINDDEAFWIRSIILMPLLLMSTFYARAIQKFGGHRSFLSHSYFVSTFIRLMYFGFPFILVFRHYFIDPLYVEFSAIYLGLVLADSLHTSADFISGEMNFGNRMGGKNEHLKHLLKHLYDFPSDDVIKRKAYKKDYTKYIHDAGYKKLNSGDNQ